MTAGFVTATVLAVLLVLLLVGALVVVLGLRRRLQAAEAEAAGLREQLEATRRVDLPRNPRVRQATQAAGFAVRAVVETASRLRESGVRGTLLSSVDDFTDWALAARTEIARIAGPDGSVTIFFSDIEGSTALNSELGDATWVKVLASHDALLRTFVEKHRGQVVKNQGDGYMVVFSTPELAVRAALDIQRALGAKRQRKRHLRRTPVRVRIGLHRGTTVEREGDYFGSNVAMAARVAALADGGEVLVTHAVAEEVADLPGLVFTEEETVELKGLPGEHRLWLVQEA